MSVADKKRKSSVVVIEATIDDMNPQCYDAVMERLFAAGALDVVLIPVQAKKNRPAVILSCQAPSSKKDAICNLMLKETTTFGVRFYPVERKILTRQFRVLTTQQGNIRVKMGFDARGKLIKQVPEYEDVKRWAKRTGIPLPVAFQEITASTIMATKRSKR